MVLVPHQGPTQCPKSELEGFALQAYTNLFHIIFIIYITEDNVSSPGLSTRKKSGL